MTIIIENASEDLAKVIKGIAKIGNAKVKTNKLKSDIEAEMIVQIIKEYEMEHNKGLTNHYKSFEDFEKGINAKI
ncbi:hypothetical protein [Helicobacter cappadocius]|uniref:Uncharacterized protein n=1 Tax=Helicobacter cappadocius TaxID=3063998 RepID=A0AA90TBJ2_9HELI|nr:MULTISPECIES: hypothetical protein [unclassified Helicobacter]MDO7253053.1 hypothetical protein [Helicobacter sp. faydin-H75]MDP2538821.1 hypothetical protein [Helicobacter sp. faydin-H76]